MTERLSEGEHPPKSFVEATEEFFQDAASELQEAIRNVRDGKLEETKVVSQILRDLRASFRQAVEERNRIDELRRQSSDVTRDHTLDFDAARVEIGRRLACLRDAGDG